MRCAASSRAALCVAVLARSQSPQSAARLLAGLDDADPAVRLATLSALAGRGTAVAEQRIAALATDDPDAAVRHAARAALR